MNERLTILLASRQLEERPAPDAEVRSAWEKAIATWKSVVPGQLHPESEFTLAYQAGLQAGTAVLRCAGFRARGGDHHFNTFAGVAAVGSGVLGQAGRELEGMRAARHEAVYATRVVLGADDVAELRRRVEQLLGGAYLYLCDSRPALRGVLERP